MKVNILFERVLDFYSGKHPEVQQQGQNGQQGGVVKVSQPISSSQLLPPGGMVMPPPPQMQQGAPQMQSPDFNSMYEQNPTPLENAAVPQFEPMAANEGMGGDGAQRDEDREEGL